MKRRRVSIRAAASADVRRAREWYERQRVGLGDEFLVSIAEALLRLEEEAERLPEYYLGFRRMFIKRFPYKVFFRLKGDEAIVFRVLHAAREHTRIVKE